MNFYGYQLYDLSPKEKLLLESADDNGRRSNAIKALILLHRKFVSPYDFKRSLSSIIDNPMTGMLIYSHCIIDPKDEKVYYWKNEKEGVIEKGISDLSGTTREFLKMNEVFGGLLCFGINEKVKVFPFHESFNWNVGDTTADKLVVKGTHMWQEMERMFVIRRALLGLDFLMDSVPVNAVHEVHWRTEIKYEPLAEEYLFKDFSLKDVQNKNEYRYCQHKYMDYVNQIDPRYEVNKMIEKNLLQD